MSINGSTNANGDVAAGIDPLELGVWDPLVEPLAIMLLHIVAPSNQNPQWKDICDDCKDRYRGKAGTGCTISLARSSSGPYGPVGLRRN